MAGDCHLNVYRSDRFCRDDHLFLSQYFRAIKTLGDRGSPTQSPPELPTDKVAIDPEAIGKNVAHVIELQNKHGQLQAEYVAMQQLLNNVENGSGILHDMALQTAQDMPQYEFAPVQMYRAALAEAKVQTIDRMKLLSEQINSIAAELEQLNENDGPQAADDGH